MPINVEIAKEAATISRFLCREQLFNDYIEMYGDYPRDGDMSFNEYTSKRIQTHKEADIGGWYKVDDATPELFHSITGISYSKQVEVISKGNIRTSNTMNSEFPKHLAVSHWRLIK